MRFKWIVALLPLCIIILPARAEDFWAKKPYQHWSAEETRRILEDSPWARTVAVSTVVTPPPGVPSIAGNAGDYESEAVTDPTIRYTLQFRSAAPIREAQVRSSQFGSHYDGMRPEQKAAFDGNASKFLAVTFPDRVVVSVTFHSNVLNYESMLRSYWEKQSVATLSMSVYLNTKKEKLSLMNYGFKDDTFQFVFPRPKQLGPDETLSLEFVHPRIDRIGRQRIFQEFKVKKMLVRGEPEF
jgi:hypothetical protein